MIEGKQYVLWGSAGHAKVLDEAIRQKHGRVVALFDNSPEAISSIAHVPLVGGEGAFPAWAESRSDHQNLFGLVAIGGSRGQDRISLQSLMARYGLRIEPLIHPKAFVADNAQLGAGSQVLAAAVVAAHACIGAACIVNHQASMDHECQLDDGVHVAPGATLCGSVHVEKNAMIGAGAVVLPRVHIGKRSIVGAGSVVTCDVIDDVIVAGNPASILRHLL